MIRQANRGPAELHGRIIDVDSHEMVSSLEWAEIFGPAAGEIAAKAEFVLRQTGENNVADPTYPGDVMEITDDSVWSVKGTKAPGASDFGRRLEVLDQMGVDRQLVFPTSGLIFGQMADGGSPINQHWIREGDSAEYLTDLAQAALREYNDWVVRQTSLSPDRIRPVPYLWHGSPLDDLIEETASLIARGVKAVHVSCGAPTAGRSPADPALDPFWNLLEQNDVPLLFHVGHGSRFLDPIWGQNVPAFARGKVESIELGSTPYPFFSMHHAPQNYIAVMVLGGVFERFPRLRLGVIELGAAWFGPFAAHLDMWADKVYRARFAPFLSMAPSEYLARNVRVTPFNTFESVQDYIAAYPRLADCYCFSTDYPHVEGGRHSLRENQARLSTLGPEVVEGFFVRNAQWILP